MTDLLALLQGVSPFVAVIFLGILYFQTRGKEADAALKAAEIEREAARFRAEAETRRDEREARLATAAAAEQARQLQVEEQIAVVLAQTVALLATLNTGQQSIETAIVKADKRAGTQVRGAQKNILEAITKVQELITQALDMLAKQEDQPDAMARIERAIVALKARQAAEADDATVESEAA